MLHTYGMRIYIFYLAVGLKLNSDVHSIANIYLDKNIDILYKNGIIFYIHVHFILNLVYFYYMEKPDSTPKQEPIVSPETEEAVRNSFARLREAVTGAHDVTLERLAAKLAGGEQLSQEEKKIRDEHSEELEAIIAKMGGISVAPSAHLQQIQENPFLNPHAEEIAEQKGEELPTSDTERVPIDTELENTPKMPSETNEISSEEAKRLLEEYAEKHNINPSARPWKSDEERDLVMEEAGAVSLEEAHKIFGTTPTPESDWNRNALKVEAATDNAPTESLESTSIKEVPNNTTATIIDSEKPADEDYQNIMTSKFLAEDFENKTPVKSGDEKKPEHIASYADLYSAEELGAGKEKKSEEGEVLEKVNGNKNEKPKNLSKLEIESAIRKVASGKQESATIEIDKDDPYIESLLAAKAELSKEKNPRVLSTIDSELNSASEKFNRADNAESALLRLKENLTKIDRVKDAGEYEKMERKIAVLERISTKLEAKKQTQDRSFVERGLDFFKDNIAERWRKGNWMMKVGVGLGLAGAGVAAAMTGAPLLGAAAAVGGFALRGLGMYSVYQGVKAGQIAKFGNKTALEMEEIFRKGTEAEKAAATEQIIVENKWSKKGLFWSAVVGAVSFGTPAILAHQDSILEFLQLDKAAAAGPDVSAGAAVTPETLAPTSGVMLPPDSPFEHAEVTVRAGDTMYKILAEEFNISDHVPAVGGQYNAIENILTQIKANPTAFGITSGNVDMLAIGDTIDIAKINEIVQNSKIGGESIFDHANKLPAAVVAGIENYMPPASREALAAVATQKAVVVSETATTAIGNIGGGAGGPTQPEVPAPPAPLETPTEIIGEVEGEGQEETATEVVGENNTAELQLQSDPATRIANLTELFRLNGLDFGSFVRESGFRPIGEIMQVSNPDQSQQNIINILNTISKNSGVPIPQTGNVLAYLSGIQTPTIATTQNI
jgi:hypothetical protein